MSDGQNGYGVKPQVPQAGRPWQSAYAPYAKTIMVQQDAGMPILRRLADVKPEPMQWIWDGRIPLGCITVLAGDAGIGKSTLTACIAAHVSTGREWPEGSICRLGSVLLITSEDSPSATIRPRLEANGADLSRVHLLENAAYTLADVSLLEDSLNQVEACRLIIIDPVGSFLGSIDSNNESEVRGVLAPVARLAQQHGTAVLLVAHYRKNAEGPPDGRIMASRAFTAIARAVWHLRKGRTGKRLLIPGKNNLVVEPVPAAFRIDAKQGRVEWSNDPADLQAAGQAPTAKRPNAKRSRGRPQDEQKGAAIEAWLRGQFRAGPVQARKLKTAAKDDGHAWNAVQKAMKAIGVTAKRQDGTQHEWAYIGPTTDSTDKSDNPLEGGQ